MPCRSTAKHDNIDDPQQDIALGLDHPDRMEWEPHLPARLYRLSHAARRGDPPALLDEIAAGPLVKMTRLAFSDPDGELWRYAVSVDGKQLWASTLATWFARHQQSQKNEAPAPSDRAKE